MTYTASPGVLANLIVSPEDYKTRAQVQYSFSFETANALYAFGDMAIIVPSELEVDESALAFTPSVGISLTNIITLSWDETTRTITINNAFEQAVSAPTFVAFTIDSGLQNAYSVEPITPITVQTLDPEGHIVDQGYSEAITFTANEINAIEATACADKQTSSTTEEVCTYQLKFLIGAQYSIESDSMIEIELPEDLVIPDRTVTQDDSYTDGIADLTADFGTSFDNRIVFVGGAFLASSAPNGENWSQDSFSVYVAGILTPRSTAPTLSFKAKIKTASGFVQYKKEQGVYSSVYQAKDFTNVGIHR